MQQKTIGKNFEVIWDVALYEIDDIALRSHNLPYRSATDVAGSRVSGGVFLRKVIQFS